MFEEQLERRFLFPQIYELMQQYVALGADTLRWKTLF